MCQHILTTSDSYRTQSGGRCSGTDRGNFVAVKISEEDAAGHEILIRGN